MLRISQRSLRLASFGLEMGLAVLIGIGGGYYLDACFETRPLFFWLGFILGMGAAVKAVADAVRFAKKDENAE